MDSKKQQQKRNLSRKGPLQAGIRVVAGRRLPSANNDDAWLEECQALYAKLPKHSRYAQHKLRLLSNAMQLLMRDRAERTNEEANKLQELLVKLNISTQHTHAASAQHHQQQDHQHQEQQQPALSGNTPNAAEGTPTTSDMYD